MESLRGDLEEVLLAANCRGVPAKVSTEKELTATTLLAAFYTMAVRQVRLKVLAHELLMSV
jgi:hypothetical protein